MNFLVKIVSFGLSKFSSDFIDTQCCPHENSLVFYLVDDDTLKKFVNLMKENDNPAR